MLLALRLLGFDYAASFATAVRLENPGGFRLLVDPVGYGATRFEDVAEVLLFLGPALLLALVRSAPGVARPVRWIWLATVGSVAGAFLLGAFKTGETARCCLFALPLLVLPVVERFDGATSERELRLLLRATLAFGLVLQLVGDWFW